MDQSNTTAPTRPAMITKQQIKRDRRACIHTHTLLIPIVVRDVCCGTPSRRTPQRTKSGTMRQSQLLSLITLFEQIGQECAKRKVAIKEATDSTTISCVSMMARRYRARGEKVVQEMLKYIDRLGVGPRSMWPRTIHAGVGTSSCNADTKMTVLTECENPQDAKGVRRKESEPILRSTYNSERHEHN